MNKAKELGFLFYKEYKCKFDKAKKYLIQLTNHKMFMIADRGVNQKDGYGLDIVVEKPVELYTDSGIFTYYESFKTVDEAFEYLKKF
jgi:hypothetical protein